MNLYLISQDVNIYYDTYDSMVVAAESWQEAVRIDPSSFYEWSDAEDSWMFVFHDGVREKRENNSWAPIKDLKVKILAKNIPSYIEKGVILASYHAG